MRGVQLDVLRGSSLGNILQDAMVFVQLAGQPVLSNHAQTTPWPTALTMATYGSATDLWGQSMILPSDVNAAGFGANLAVKYSGSGGSDWAYVDGMKLSVTYCAHP